MKNFFLSLIAVFMMSSIVYAKNDDGRKPKKINTVKKKLKKAEGRVDSFKVVGESSGEDAAGRLFCRITVNYYYGGQYVGQQTYTGYTCPLLLEFNCRQWKANSLEVINNWVDNNGTMYPSSDITC